MGRLTQWQYASRLFLVPFGEIQREVVLSVPPPARVTIYRRLMVRIAERLARRCGALALVTGDSLGQVASQTLHNLACIDAAGELPILRPLIGMDKLEITAQAEAIDTFEISIEPDADCCTLFVPRHPGTRMSLEEARRSSAGSTSRRSWRWVSTARWRRALSSRRGQGCFPRARGDRGPRRSRCRSERPGPGGGDRAGRWDPGWSARWPGGFSPCSTVALT